MEVTLKTETLMDILWAERVIKNSNGYLQDKTIHINAKDVLGQVKEAVDILTMDYDYELKYLKDRKED